MKHGDLLVSMGLVMVPLALFTQGPLRATLGIPFVLFLPGYTLVAALFPRIVQLVRATAEQQVEVSHRADTL